MSVVVRTGKEPIANRAGARRRFRAVELNKKSPLPQRATGSLHLSAFLPSVAITLTLPLSAASALVALQSALLSQGIQPRLGAVEICPLHSRLTAFAARFNSAAARRPRESARFVHSLCCSLQFSHGPDRRNLRTSLTAFAVRFNSATARNRGSLRVNPFCVHRESTIQKMGSGWRNPIAVQVSFGNSTDNLKVRINAYPVPA